MPAFKLRNSTKKRNVTLITGASSGIGFELAKLFAERGDHLILIAHEKEKIKRAGKALEKEFPRASVKWITADLSNEKGVQGVIRQVKSQNVFVQNLVNNAGFALYGAFAQADAKIETEMMHVNILALTHLTKAFLPEMLMHKEGKILNLGSTAAFQPGPLMAIYYASKAFVLSFSEALSNELHGSGVSVTCLCPGPTESNFQNRAMMLDSRIARDGARMSAKEVARAGFDALMQEKSLVIPGLRNQIGAFAVRLAPREIVTQTVRNIQEAKTKK